MPKSAINGNKSLKNIIGETSVVSAWDGPKNSSNADGGGEPAAPTSGEEAAVAEIAGGKGKKGKGKQKQTLFTLGVFPT